MKKVALIFLCVSLFVVASIAFASSGHSVTVSLKFRGLDNVETGDGYIIKSNAAGSYVGLVSAAQSSVFQNGDKISMLQDSSETFYIPVSAGTGNVAGKMASIKDNKLVNEPFLKHELNGTFSVEIIIRKNLGIIGDFVQFNSIHIN
ncbi:MAG: hypothetical protein ABIG30_00250, partial [Candidatus Aenigmatarchaeota archaeon]